MFFPLPIPWHMGRTVVTVADTWEVEPRPDLFLKRPFFPPAAEYDPDEEGWSMTAVWFTSEVRMLETLSRHHPQHPNIKEVSGPGVPGQVAHLARRARRSQAERVCTLRNPRFELQGGCETPYKKGGNKARPASSSIGQSGMGVSWHFPCEWEAKVVAAMGTCSNK